MVFSSKQEFKKAVGSHAINTRRSLYFNKNDKIRVYARCRGEDCKWGINALKVGDEETFQIRKYMPTHNCAPTFNVTNVSSNWLGERFVPAFQNDPKKSVKGWRKEIIRKLNVNISKQQAYRAKSKALQIIEGVPDLQYTKLWDYAQELRDSNPGSSIVLQTEEIDGQDRLSKMYVCFEAVKRGFKAGCRPFIGVDGCWLKGPHGGILLSAVGVDPSNALYPIAYAVVSKENKETWEWFLILLKNDLNILRGGADYTFMSDKQKGLINAFNDVFPDCEHRFCVRHLHNNFKTAGFRGLAYKVALWKAARASTMGFFNQSMLEMREMNENAAAWFDNKHPRQWSKSHFSEKCRCDMLLNNVCESFNSCILDAREKPIITMLEWIRQWLMERFQVCRDRALHNWKRRLPPKIKEILKMHMDRIGDCIPIKGNSRHYQIETGNGSQYAVDLLLRSCTCRLWGLSGIPCKHAIAAIVHEREDPELFVDEAYTVQTYRRVYEPTIMPIVGYIDWAETMYIPPLPPNFGRSKGRPTKARRMEPDEVHGKKKRTKTGERMRRQQKSLKCSRCGQTGHNMKTCTQPRVDEEGSQQVKSSTRKRKLRVRKNKFKKNASGSGSRSEVTNAKEGTQNESNRDNLEGGSILPPVSQPRGLIDEYDEEFEALMSQASSASHLTGLGIPTVRVTPGPNCTQQLQMSKGLNLVPPPMHTGPILRATPPGLSGGLRPQFSTQTREERSSKAIFISGGKKFDLSQYSHGSGKGKDKMN